MVSLWDSTKSRSIKLAFTLTKVYVSEFLSPPLSCPVLSVRCRPDVPTRVEHRHPFSSTLYPVASHPQGTVKSPLLQGVHEVLDGCHPAIDKLDIVDCCILGKWGSCIGASIRNENWKIVSVVSISQCGLHADVRSHSSERDIPDSAGTEDDIEIGSIKGTVFLFLNYVCQRNHE